MFRPGGGSVRADRPRCLPAALGGGSISSFWWTDRRSSAHRTWADAELSSRYRLSAHVRRLFRARGGRDPCDSGSQVERCMRGYFAALSGRRRRAARGLDAVVLPRWRGGDAAWLQRDRLRAGHGHRREIHPVRKAGAFSPRLPSLLPRRTSRRATRYPSPWCPLCGVEWILQWTRSLHPPGCGHDVSKRLLSRLTRGQV